MRFTKNFVVIICIILFANIIPLRAGENKIIGYLQVQYLNDQSKEAVENNFVIHRARAGISGKVKEKITYNVVFGAVEPPDKNPHLVQGFVDFNYKPYLKIKFGQFLLPFGIE